MTLDEDEQYILDYLKTLRAQYVSAREICRRAAGKRRYFDEPDWAKPVLRRMFAKGILECDSSSHYRIKPATSKKQVRRWVAPHIARLLKEKCKEVEGTYVVDEDLPDEDGKEEGTKPA